MVTERAICPGSSAALIYLEWLGVDAVWLTPIYRSPMLDFGYDIADFCSVDPLFGSLDDFDRLIDLLHARGIRLILDFVPNHTSVEHAWFKESRSSRLNPKRNWYVWADPEPNGGPPNNWLSRFGGSAWQWDEGTGQYYYHSFLLEQPDLNWRNPPWLTSSASGWGAGAVVFASTRALFSPRTRCCATSRPIQRHAKNPRRR